MKRGAGKREVTGSFKKTHNRSSLGPYTGRSLLQRTSLGFRKRAEEECVPVKGTGSKARAAGFRVWLFFLLLV